MSKVKITNINKFISFIIILVLIIVFVLILVVTLSSKKITNNTNISKLDSSKYAEQILNEYEKEGKKEEFIETYNEIQSAIGTYLIDNSTLEEGSFDLAVSQIQENLNKDSWDILGIDKPSEWNGSFILNSDGTLKFKFSAKSIEPSWIKDEDVKDMIEIN